MKNLNAVISLLFLVVFIWSCDSDSASPEDGALSSTEEAGDSSGSFSIDGATTTTSNGGTGNGNGGGGEAGLVTAAEWNDLSQWSFWKGLFDTKDYTSKAAYWKFHNLNRVSVLVTNETGTPVNDIAVRLEKNSTIVWEARTDIFGTAELFIGMQQAIQAPTLSEYRLVINNIASPAGVTLFESGINEFSISSEPNTNNKVEIAFIVDATGSMGDEIEFLKKDLLSVIEKVEQDSPSLNVMTGTVFYRDEGDDYVAKHSGFTGNPETTLKFIKEQNADGGGDYAEAVHTALKTALSELQWSSNAKTRLAFLVLDAPPHNNTQVITQLQTSILEAAKKGIKIIPITASGIDEETEYLMRSFAIATNGTYVFITNDSGIGNEHLEASVGEYQVEKLNDLMVRLITKYAN